MGTIVNCIKDSAKLTSVFGCWPSFHDAEVISISLDRDPQNHRATLTAAIHVFEMTSEVSEKDTYVCRHHSIVSIRFVEIDELTLASFNHQNALMGLEIEDISSRQQERVKLSVHFDAGALDASLFAIRLRFCL
jgi:hypothetical protein